MAAEANQQRAKVSIHTPAWGVTCIWRKGSRITPCFNPHSRMGSDLINYEVSRLLRVSIHTPAWGVTYTWYACSIIYQVSIHTPAWGVTLLANSKRINYVCFNPHSRMGSDAFKLLNRFKPSRFNPHSRMGSDSVIGSLLSTILVSIHTPAWGVTNLPLCSRCLSAVSIHTPAWGVTFHLVIVLIYPLFQSTLPHGE